MPSNCYFTCQTKVALNTVKTSNKIDYKEVVSNAA